MWQLFPNCEDEFLSEEKRFTLVTGNNKTLHQVASILKIYDAIVYLYIQNPKCALHNLDFPHHLLPHTIGSGDEFVGNNF